MQSTNTQLRSLLQKLDGKMELIIKEGVRLVGILKNNCYFSKFTLDKNELYEIYQFIALIKTELLKALSEQLIFTVKNLVCIQSKTPLKLQQQILILFSACFYHYYSNFSYQLSPKFDNFFTNEFFDVLTKFRILITNQNEFAKFCFLFFQTIQKIISKFQSNHDYIQKLLQFYNPNVEMQRKSNEQINEDEDEEEHLIGVLNDYIKEKNKSKENNPKKKFLTYLISAKEYLVDLVLESKQKQKFIQKKSNEEIVQLIEKLNIPNTMNNTENSSIEDQFQIPESNVNLDFTLPYVQKEDIDNDIEMTNVLGDNNKAEDNSEEHLNTSSTESSKSFYSKRVLSELTRMELTEENKKLVENISEKVDEIFLEVLLNHSQKSICMIQNFVCYRVHVDSKMIRLLPEFKNLKNELTLEYVVTAKNLYYRILEIYFSIQDLQYIDLDIFSKVLQKKKIEIKFFNCYYKFLEGFSSEIKKHGNSWNYNIKEVISNFLEEQYQIWDKNIVANGKNLTYFCMV